MASAKWNTPGTRTANLLLGSQLDSLASGAESTAFTYDNSTNLDLYACLTIKLGAITPTVTTGLTVRVRISDGTDVSDQVGGDRYVLPVTTTASAKTLIIPMLRLYPFSMRISIENNCGVALSALNNAVYMRPYNESIV